MWREGHLRCSTCIWDDLTRLALNSRWLCPSGVATAVEQADSLASQVSLGASLRANESSKRSLGSKLSSQLLKVFKHSHSLHSRCPKIPETLARAGGYGSRPVRSLLACSKIPTASWTVLGVRVGATESPWMWPWWSELNHSLCSAGSIDQAPPGV